MVLEIIFSLIDATNNDVDTFLWSDKGVWIVDVYPLLSVGYSRV